VTPEPTARAVRRPSARSAGRPPAPREPASPALVSPPPTGAPAPDPADRLRRDLRPRARVLAVASGKGGVGKTNLAVNLAIALSATGQRVLLIDADVGLANVDLVLGRRPRGHLGHVLAGRMRLAEAVQPGPAGIRWVPGAARPPGGAGLDEARRRWLLEGLADLEAAHDFLVLDLPAGIGAGVLGCVREADDLVLVTTPEPPALMDAYALLKAAAAGPGPLPDRVGLVVNMVAHRREAREVHQRLAATAERFLGLEVALLGHVFCDGHVGRAVQRQQPLLLAYPHSQAAWCIKRVATALLEGAPRPAGRRFAFLRRVANLFVGSDR